jgi:hypothetical protein
MKLNHKGPRAAKPQPTRNGYFTTKARRIRNFFSQNLWALRAFVVKNGFTDGYGRQEQSLKICASRENF